MSAVHHCRETSDEEAYAILHIDHPQSKKKKERKKGGDKKKGTVCPVDTLYIYIILNVNSSA